jgi:uncharacterized membrane protein YvbJ
MKIKVPQEQLSEQDVAINKFKQIRMRKNIAIGAVAVLVLAFVILRMVGAMYSSEAATGEKLRFAKLYNAIADGQQITSEHEVIKEIEQISQKMLEDQNTASSYGYGSFVVIILLAICAVLLWQIGKTEKFYMQSH